MVSTCSNTRVSMLPYGASMYAYTSANTCSNTRASTCSNTRASTCSNTRVSTCSNTRAIMHVHDYFLKTCVPGAYSDRFLKNSEPGNTPKEWFLSGKRPKEGERVVLGHFHERVGESPGRYENFGTS